MSNNIKIKKFGDFMPKKKHSKILNCLIVRGNLRGTLFSRPTDFEMMIYFTPFKKMIFDISIDNVTLMDKRLKLDFQIGDRIEKAKDWVGKNKHIIVDEIIRFD